MLKIRQLFFLLALIGISHGVENNRPIIGVLSQKPPSSLLAIDPDAESYIAASYIKWVEAAGGRAVPIFINRDDAYYQEIFNSVNGVLFPGGSTGLVTSGYGKAGLKLYNMAKEANANGDYFPLWGTCLGFELMSYMAVEKLWLTECDSYDEALNLGVLSEALDSRLLSAAPVDVLDILVNENVTSNFHHKCLTMQNYTVSGLNQHFRVLALNTDINGLEFIAAWEGITEPFYGTQFHPEKNVFEWTTKYMSIPHSAHAVKLECFSGISSLVKLEKMVINFQVLRWSSKGSSTTIREPTLEIKVQRSRRPTFSTQQAPG